MAGNRHLGKAKEAKDAKFASMKRKQGTKNRRLPWRGPLTTLLCFWLGGMCLTISHSVYVSESHETGTIEPSMLVWILDCTGILLIIAPFVMTACWIVMAISKAVVSAWKFGRRHFKRRSPLLVALLAMVEAAGTTIRPSVGGPSGFADTESATNAPIRAGALVDARTFTGSIALDATVSNAVEVAFGRSGADGNLAPGEETFAVGWDGGRWFFASATERIESAEIDGPARRTLSFSVRVPAAGPPWDLSVSADGAGSAFAELVAAPPDWLFSRNWNVVRLTTRGVDDPGESVSVRFATDPGMVILK